MTTKQPPDPVARMLADRDRKADKALRLFASGSWERAALRAALLDPDLAGYLRLEIEEESRIAELYFHPDGDARKPGRRTLRPISVPVPFSMLLKVCGGDEAGLLQELGALQREMDGEDARLDADKLTDPECAALRRLLRGEATSKELRAPPIGLSERALHRLEFECELIERAGGGKSHRGLYKLTKWGRCVAETLG